MYKEYILTELPKLKNEKVNYKAMEGMEVDVVFNHVKYRIRILEYINASAPRFRTLCNGIEYTVQCGSFIRGNFSGVVGYEQPSKNKFEYSEEHKCWFGWTQKGEKFAFDGDDKTVEFIKKHTWSIYNNKVECGKIKKTLKQVVLGIENTRRNNITNISNKLNLNGAYCDNRKCNLKFRNWGEENRINKNNNKKYTYNMKVSSDNKHIYILDENNNEFITDNDSFIINIVERNKCKVDIRNSTKKYVRCGNNDLHREILGITDRKYSEWFVDHINGDGTDNRLENLIITNHYGNMCNKQESKGYLKTVSGSYKVQFMCRYYDEKLYNGKPRVPTYKDENDAIKEVERRRKYILENRLQFKSKDELDIFLDWCKDNKYIDYNEAWEKYKLIK